MISSSPPPIKPLNSKTEEITTQTETPIYMDKYSLEYFPALFLESSLNTPTCANSLNSHLG